jgi:hypothetical protein
MKTQKQTKTLLFVLSTALLLFAANHTSHAAVIAFTDINGDYNSGISGPWLYTHAVDFGNNNATYPVATVNGVVFGNGGTGAGAFPGATGSQSVGTGTSSIPNSHPGNVNFGLNGQGIQDMLADFVYNDANAEITLTGLEPGTLYQFRLYNRNWGGPRDQSFGFDTDGLAGFEDTVTYNQADFGVPRSIDYVYRLAAGVTTLTVNIDRIVPTDGTYHLYGLTNEYYGNRVPEPSTVLLLGGGVVLVNVLRRKRYRFAD